MFHHTGVSDVSDKYFVKPLLYRIQQRIGEDAWQHAIKATEGMTIEQLYQDIMNTPFPTENDNS